MRRIAFLRGLNVGGHTVKMDRLRALCSEAGLAHVETFIASGNVIFDADRRRASTVEALIEDTLEAALGYEVATFIRTPAELAHLVAANPYADRELVGTASVAVGFLKEPLPEAQAAEVRAASNEVDLLDAIGRELWWFAGNGQGRSTIDDRTWRRLALPTMTVRNLTTVSKLAARYGA